MSDEPVEEEVKPEIPIQDQWPLTLLELEQRLLAKILHKRDRDKSKMVFYLKIPDEETKAMVLNEITRISAFDYNDLEPKEVTEMRREIIKAWVEKNKIPVAEATEERP